MGTLLLRPPGHRRDVALRPAATAMVWLGEGHPHEMIAVPGVALADADALVAVELSTVCETDVCAVQGRRSAPAPVVLGHESVGRIIDIGDAGVVAVDGTPLRVGDRVVWSPTISCGACDRCRSGLPQRCRTLGRYGHDRIGAHGDLTGAFGSHVQLRSGTAIVRAPESLPAAVLAPASCATATAWAAVAAARRDLDGAPVRVHGAGLVGLTAAAIAAELGAAVEVCDPDPQRAAMAARWLGSSCVERDPEVVIDASGHAAAEAVDGVAVGGAVVLIGQEVGTGPVLFDAERIVRTLVTVTAVQDGSPHDLADAVAFLAGRGRAYPFAEAVGQVRQLAELDAAMEAASASGAPLRIGVVPG
ncbi:alcohol dehydrogenase catalytic domain-containing protein [Microbacterium sp. XT11]|uniref:alcohol dehydrogenase catalytic domain-containing protein n=1 Tax=Microbacterium sp. XT11 TaxID=367477 RepID=UPI00082DC611|nr:alcohol dehydrogenase catalytic domain-containing protein [Microbacterium sp. XT11]